MRGLLLCILAISGFGVSHFFSRELAHATVITVVNLDDAGEGFNDPSPPDSASAAGGNGGATLGAQRQIALQNAADVWARFIESSVEIIIDANFDPLTCTSTSATLGSAGTKTVHRDFAGAPLANTWFPQALANSISGGDLSDLSDIAARFNSSIGTSCPFPLVWYYGLDGNPPGGALDFVTVALHEIGHGLGFQSFVDLISGTKLLGFDDTFSRNLEDHSTGKLYPNMTDAERVAASQNTTNLHWVGPNVVAASGFLTAGVHLSGHVQMYAPNPQRLGSSVSHFDTAVAPNELMEPAYTSANHDVRLTLDLFADLGWLILDESTEGDYDGDGKSDIGVYRGGVWYIIRSSDGGSMVVGWGGALQDISVPADYDGDGKTDISVYRQGAWFILNSSGGSALINWGGVAQDVPVQADYDGDGRTDSAVYRDGMWYIRRSSDGGTTVVGWGGLEQDIRVQADYDGDGRTDIAVYRNGIWYIRRSSDSGTMVVGWGGLAQDIPVPADYDGDGKTDLAVYRDGIWFIRRSSDTGTTIVTWGIAGDIPIID